MNSPDAIKAALGGVGPDHRRDRTSTTRSSQATRCCRSISEQGAADHARTGPGLAVYPQVSQALQQATADVVAGKSVDEAAAAYQGGRGEGRRRRGQGPTS